MRASRLSALVLLIVTASFLLVYCRTHPLTTPPAVRPAIVGRAGPPWAYPDPTRTPGFANPAITQQNIRETICNPKWTSTIRPPSSYTTQLKLQQIAAWGLTGSKSDYEEDHFISLELGGDPKDPRNLWPEAYAPNPGAREKDVVENELHREVCSGQLSLLDAQTSIVTDWYAIYLDIQARPKPKP
jgi:hypothetical protein